MAITRVSKEQEKVDEPQPFATISLKFFADGTYGVSIEGEGPRVTQRLLERGLLVAAKQISVLKRLKHSESTEHLAQERERRRQELEASLRAPSTSSLKELFENGR